MGRHRNVLSEEAHWRKDARYLGYTGCWRTECPSKTRLTAAEEHVGGDEALAFIVEFRRRIEGRAMSNEDKVSLTKLLVQPQVSS